jgi:hypothetical protein
MARTWEGNEERIRSIIAAFYAAYNAPGFGFLELYNYLRASNMTDGILLHFGRKPRFYRWAMADRRTAGTNY